MEYVYKTQGTCSMNIELNVEDGVVKERRRFIENGMPLGELAQFVQGKEEDE